MTVKPESIEEWCYLVPHVFSEEDWQATLKTLSSTMSYCGSPWGGSLLKFVLENLLVVDPPGDPATILTPAWLQGHRIGPERGCQQTCLR